MVWPFDRRSASIRRAKVDEKVDMHGVYHPQAALGHSVTIVADSHRYLGGKHIDRRYIHENF